MINYDVEIIPRGAYYQDRLKKIHFNYKFKGNSLKNIIFFIFVKLLLNFKFFFLINIIK